MQVGTTKDQGLYNKPSAAVHPGALAAGTLPQYNTIPEFRRSLMLSSSKSWQGGYLCVVYVLRLLVAQTVTYI